MNMHEAMSKKLIMKQQKAYRFNTRGQFNKLIKAYGESYFSLIDIGNHKQGYLYVERNGWTSATIKKFRSNPLYKDLEEISFARAMKESPTNVCKRTKNKRTKKEGIDWILISSHLKKAKELVGKTLWSDIHKKEWTPESCVVVFDKEDINLSIKDIPIFKKQGFAVCIVNEDFSTEVNSFLSLPKKIKLSNDYDAQIFKDKVVVGCQVIPKEKIQEILESMNRAENKY